MSHASKTTPPGAQGGGEAMPAGEIGKGGRSVDNGPEEFRDALVEAPSKLRLTEENTALEEIPREVIDAVGAYDTDCAGGCG